MNNPTPRPKATWTLRRLACSAAAMAMLGCSATEFTSSTDQTSRESPAATPTATATGSSTTPQEIEPPAAKPSADAQPQPPAKTGSAKDDAGAKIGAGTDATTAKSLAFSCPQGQGDAHLESDVLGATHTLVRLKGEFCGVLPQSTAAPVTIMFVLDWSGSMETNDPLIGGSCGRLAAAQAVLQKIQAAAGPTGKVAVGIVPFGTTALRPVAPVDLASFQSSNLDEQTFCRHDGGTTNYDSAFRAAHQLMTGVSGTKAVYFITDGEPNTSGDAPQPARTGFGRFGNAARIAELRQAYAQGSQSATALRALPDLLFNAIYLTDRTGDNQSVPGFTAPDPETYLQQIAGGAANERTAANAQDLANQIQTFQIPTAAPSLDLATAAGDVSAASFGSHSFKLESLAPKAGQPGVWEFTTEAFPLAGGHAPTDNAVSISVKGSDGATYKASAVLKYSVDPNAGG